MIAQELLGNVNVVASASGVPLALRDYGAVTFITFEADGSTILTLTQHPKAADGTADTGSEAALAVDSRAFKAPGVGGTWSTGPTPSSGAYDLDDDTVNDAMVVTVRADELSDGYDFIEATVDGGYAVAILHDPVHRVAATKLASPLTA